MVQPSQIHHTSCSTALAAPTDIEETRSFQENNNTHTPTTRSSQNDFQTLLDTIQRLTQELQQARAEINSLRSQTDKLQQQLLQQNQTADPFPSLNQQPPRRNPEAMTQMSNIESAPWHEPAKIQRIKDNLIATRDQRRLQRQEAAAHFLQPPSDNQGFQYIYVPTKARVQSDRLDPVCESLTLISTESLTYIILIETSWPYWFIMTMLLVVNIVIFYKISVVLK
ncbi:hypothetical protein RO3G_01651 [Rhizopus delemar RA 99-880]|uniref:Uncharacterized protein n=1 Tax=Rhizopus delemar (strain RA 99-880 / ATCC MYA-4621 / FGSC 9543 / NRRL 43880) TaxID=246409 RepID=I1BL67_RHIO9|nr:hypothetical protein RO3G_01651 [Rhizopus delemar RA 99-880]|eukprot:EIE76947.1 hypothetical protein RO3G_01651 [Rhizopus delemar RA 99-880]